MSFAIFANFKVKVFHWVTVFFVLIADPVQSANWNVKPVDKDGLNQLEKRRVSIDFPHYATNLRISCSTSKGKEYNSTVRAGWTNDFFWGSQISKNSVKTWIGERQNRNIFRIRVSEASDKWRDQPNWITFVIKGKDLTEQLISGISGEYRSTGSYWRRCDLKAGSALRDYAGITKSSNTDRLAYLERLKRELNVLTMAQNVNVVQRTEFGVSVDFLFDFEKLLVTAETQLAQYKGKKEVEVATSTPDRSQPNSLKSDPAIEAERARKQAEEEKRLADAERARKQAEEERRLADAERARKQAEEERRLADAERARRQAEEEKRLADAERARKQAEEEKRLADAERARKQAEAEKAKLLADQEAPSIQVTGVSSQGALGTVSGLITDDGVIDFVMADGQILELNPDGSFEYEVYIPRTGKNLSIIAFDESGKRSQQTVSLDRANITAPKGPQFAALNPAGRPVKMNRKAAALIVGIAEYERTPAPAAFADKDAQYFYDYAALKLGVPEENILELINEKADRIEFKLAVRNWLTSISDSDTDLFLFFAGHGMGSDDGKSMFLLPYDGTPALLEDSAIRRDQLFEDIAALKPNSVTVFLDTCYSGSTRESEMLIAARPVLIKVNEQDIPDGFAVFTAASGDQTAKPLPQVEQGLFSYFLMKGLEGDADSNSDGQIRAGELHEYTRKNVSRLSVGAQTPEFQGDSERVLVTFQ